MRCNYPGCKYDASKTFALVDLCEAHEDAIRSETLKYYKKGKASRSSSEYLQQRITYAKIMHLIPWARVF
jgi:hypothetical protein